MPDNHQAQFEKLLASYRAYYNVNQETPAEPFDAEAVFRLHDEQYFLIRQAKISEADVSEVVFFARRGELGAEEYASLEERAWEEGLSRVVLTENHRSTDIVLILLADTVTPEAKKAVKKSRKYKSYRFGLRGWSHYRTIALEFSTGTLVHNRQGGILEKTLRNIL